MRIVISILLAAYGFGYGQPADVRFEHLTSSDGLSQNSINDVLQDRKGYLWIATQEGLNRFDGYGFTVFKHHPDDSSTISYNWVKALMEDRRGLLWAGTLGRGISIFDPAFESFLKPKCTAGNALPADAVIRTMFEAGDGSIWIGTSAGLYVLYQLRFSADPPRLTYTSSGLIPLAGGAGPDPGSFQVTALTQGPGDLIWIGTPGGLFAGKSTAGNKHDIQKSAVSLPVSCLLSTTEHLWIGAPTGLYLFNSDPGVEDALEVAQHASTPLIAREILSLTGNESSLIWAGTRRGLVGIRFDQSEGGRRDVHHMVEYSHDGANPNSLSENTVLAIHQDKAGNLWAGSKRGLNKLVQRRLHIANLKHQDGSKGIRPLPMVFSIEEDHAGSFWVGTSNGLAQYRFDRPRDIAESPRLVRWISETSPAVRLPSHTVFAMEEDRYGFLWAGTAKGLCRFNRERSQVDRLYTVETEPALKNNTVFSLKEDKDGRLWIGTAGGGVSYLDPARSKATNISAHSSVANPLAGNIVFDIVEGADGTLYLATNGGLSVKAGPENSFRNLRSGAGLDSPLSKNTVYAVHVDEDGVLWLGTRRGLNRVSISGDDEDDVSVSVFFENSVVFGILETTEGELWLSTNTSLLRLNKHSEQVLEISEADGVQNREFNQGAFLQTPDGYMFWGGIDGLTYFDPRQIRIADYAPGTVLTAFRKFNKEVPVHLQRSEHPGVTLGYDENHLSFEFASLDLTDPRRNNFRYRMEGLDTDWIASGKRRFVSYTNLDAGNYSFRVRGSNSDGIWNGDGEARLELTIYPPPWKTWWAYTAYAALAIAIVLGFVRLKTEAQARKLKQQAELLAGMRHLDRLKDEFLANTSHELRTPLNGIVGIADSLLDGVAGKLNASQRTNIALIESSGRRLTNLVNDIMDFSRLKSHDIELQIKWVDLKQMTDMVFDISRPLIAAKGVRLENEIPGAVQLVRADENRLAQVLQNLIGNAIKFTDQGEIKVTARRENGHVEVCVSDTGIGIPKSKIEKIFRSFEQVDASTSREYAGTGLGLSITKQLVSLHGGTIRAESVVGRGSQFYFTLPAGSGPAQSDDRVDWRLDPPYENIRAEPVNPALDLVVGGVAADTGEEPDRSTMYKILIVDDEPVNLQVLKNFFMIANHRVLLCRSGPEAISTVEEGEFRPDLILLDVMMPKMSGYEVCERIRENYSLHELPILLLTAKNTTDDLVRGLEAGANDYLTKPFDKNELLARVRTLLNLRNAAMRHDQLIILEQELNIARRIQESILPQSTPDLQGADIGARYIPMALMGGDFYDFHFNGGQELGILIADVSGHGIPAAFIGAMVKIAFSSEEEHAADPPRLLGNMNRTLCGKFENHFVTGSYTFIDLKNMRLIHADAGHLPLVIWRKSRQQFIELKPEGMILGWDDAFPIPAVSHNIMRGDRICFYTDGIVESLNTAGEFFGDIMFPAFFRKNELLSAVDFAKRLEAAIMDWSGNQHGFEDDVTLVIFDVVE